MSKEHDQYVRSKRIRDNAIRKMRATGATYTAIAAKFGITRQRAAVIVGAAK